MKRFWNKVVKSAGCWLWTGAHNPFGHGIFFIRRQNGRIKNMMAPRYMWELFNGPIPDGLHVLHKCDNPPCVNPDHLWLGTKKENAEDASRKGRMGKKLTAWDVREIRARTDMPRQALAKAFMVSCEHINNILTHKQWKYVL